MSKATIKIGGVALPAPSSYSVTFEDLDSDDSKRYISTGIMRRKRIRAEVMKISVVYNLCDLSDVTSIIKAIKPQTFTANLYLPNEGIYGDLTMYANKKTFNYKRVSTGLKAESFSFDLTEV